jgi:hypothetical protein
VQLLLLLKTLLDLGFIRATQLPQILAHELMYAYFERMFSMFLNPARNSSAHLAIERIAQLIYHSLLLGNYQAVWSKNPMQ